MSIARKEKKLMVVFPTTTDAMHMQQAATIHSFPGRMVPLPGNIEAGCGLAWCTDLTQKEHLMVVIEELGIHTQGFYEQDW